MGSFRAAKFLERMLSLILRTIFFSLGKKKIFSWRFLDHSQVSLAIF
jgi:hypothetical protein